MLMVSSGGRPRSVSTLELQDGSGASGDAGDVELDMSDGDDDDEERMESGRSAWAQELRDPGTRGTRIR